MMLHHPSRAPMAARNIARECIRMLVRSFPEETLSVMRARRRDAECAAFWVGAMAVAVATLRPDEPVRRELVTASYVGQHHGFDALVIYARHQAGDGLAEAAQQAMEAAAQQERDGLAETAPQAAETAAQEESDANG